MGYIVKKRVCFFRPTRLKWNFFKRKNMCADHNFRNALVTHTPAYFPSQACGKMFDFKNLLGILSSAGAIPAVGTKQSDNLRITKTSLKSQQSIRDHKSYYSFEIWKK